MAASVDDSDNHGNSSSGPDTSSSSSQKRETDRKCVSFASADCFLSKPICEIQADIEARCVREESRKRERERVRLRENRDEGVNEMIENKKWVSTSMINSE